jgi:hypothetical protein
MRLIPLLAASLALSIQPYTLAAGTKGDNRTAGTRPPACESKPAPGLPPGGIVVDAETAVRIAEVILPTVYGQGVLSQKPFKAVLAGDRWIVDGNLHGENARGGVAHLEMRKSDMQVLVITHGR